MVNDVDGDNYHDRDQYHLYDHEDDGSLGLAGGDNWAEMHRNRHRPILFLQLLPQTEKAQSINPQTTKYRYRRGTFKQRNH